MGQQHDKCFDCAYCRARGKEHNDGYFTAPSELNPLFTYLPVSLNIFYGDPFIYLNDTERCLDILEKAEHKGPVIIITKGDLMHNLKFFKKSPYDPPREWNLNLHFGLSFFGNEKYDKAATINRLVRNLEFCKYYKRGRNFTYNIEYRPLINGINDDEATIESVFKLAQRYHTSIAYSGLQVEKELEDYIKEKKLPFKPYEGYDFGMKKNVSKEIEQKFRAFSVQYNVPVFKKTSCAITYARGLDRDYNAHYYRPNEVGCPTCQNKAKCHLFKRENVKCDILDKLPFDLKLVWKEHHSCRLHREGLCKFPSPDCLDINGWLLQTDRELTTTDVRIIKWLTGFTVDAKFVELPYMQEDWLCK